MEKEEPEGRMNMASIVKRNGKFCVVHLYTDAQGKRKQKWETYKTQVEAKTRQKEIEYKEQIGTFVIPQCGTMDDLLREYGALYGKNTWAMSTYSANVGIINHYISPYLGNMKLKDITPRVLEKYYQQLLKMKPVDNPITGKPRGETVGTGTVREIHKILRNCFGQAVKWELLGLTWDCVDISEEAINTGYASISVNKELQRVNKKALSELEGKDVLLKFPEKNSRTTTVLVLKSPKTQSSVRKIFLPRTVARMLIEWKKEQDFTKDAPGSEYRDYNLVVAGPFGFPVESSTIQGALSKLIEEHDLPKVVFHSLRHSSITYKLKLNGGDVKAVQGDSGHSQSSMVTDVYSHILDDDRRMNAQLFEEAFYSGKGVEKKDEHAEAEAASDQQNSDMDALMPLYSAELEPVKHPDKSRLS